METSVAKVLHAHYISKEFNDLFGSTELREQEIIPISNLLMLRFVQMVLSTRDKEVEEAKDEHKYYVKLRVQLRDKVLEDQNAMSFLLVDTFTYSFALCRQSLKRQSRLEGVKIGTGRIQSAYQKDDIGLHQSIASKLGIGRYNVAYMPKGDK